MMLLCLAGKIQKIKKMFCYWFHWPLNTKLSIKIIVNWGLLYKKRNLAGSMRESIPLPYASLCLLAGEPCLTEGTPCIAPPFYNNKRKKIFKTFSPGCSAATSSTFISSGFSAASSSGFSCCCSSCFCCSSFCCCWTRCCCSRRCCWSCCNSCSFSLRFSCLRWRTLSGWLSRQLFRGSAGVGAASAGFGASGLRGSAGLGASGLRGSLFGAACSTFLTSVV